MNTVILSILISLCNLSILKKSVIKDQTTNIPLVKSYSVVTNDVFLAKKTREYDSEGRIKQYVLRNFELVSDRMIWKEMPNISLEPIVYEYFEDSILIHHPDLSDKIELDSKSKTNRYIKPNRFSRNKALTVHQINTFDNQGYLVRKIIFDDFISYSFLSTHYYEYSNGNMVKEKISYHNVSSDGSVNEYSAIKEFKHLSDKLNTIGNMNFGEAHLGRSDKNLVKELRISNGYVFTYQYEFNSRGYVSRKVDYDETGKKTHDYQYEYY